MTKRASPQGEIVVNLIASQVSAGRDINISVLPTPSVDVAPHLKTIFDTVTTLLNRNSVHASETMLAALEKEHASAFNDLENYHFYRLKANLLRLKHDFPAAILFLESAVARSPNRDRAQSLEAIALHLKGMHDEAFDIISQVVARSPHDAYFRAIWIETAGERFSVVQLCDAVPEGIRSDSQIALALASASMRRYEFKDAARFSEQSMLANPDDYHAKDIFAKALIMPLLKYPEDATDAHSVEIARKVIPILSELVDATRSDAPPDATSYRLLLLSLANLIAGNNARVLELLEKAQSIDPDGVEVAIQLATYHKRHGHSQAALEALDRLGGTKQARVELLKAAILAEGTTGDDIRKALDILEPGPIDNADEPIDHPRLHLAWFDLLVTTHSALKSFDRGLECLNDASAAAALSPAARDALRSVLAEAKGDTEAATNYAKAAAKAITANEDADVLTRIAHVLRRTEQLDDSSKMMAAALASDGLSLRTYRWIAAVAEEIGDYSLAIRTARIARQSGISDLELADREASILECFSVSQAVEFFNTVPGSLADGPIRRHLRLRQTLFAIATATPALLVQEATDLPMFSEVESINWVRLVTALSKTQTPIAAAERAYENLRRNPVFVESFHAMIHSVLTNASNAEALQQPEVSDAMSAVRIGDLVTKESRWVVLEPEPASPAFSDEVSPASVRGAALIGRQAGDQFFFPGEIPTQAHAYVVLEVRHKYSYRARYCLENIAERFPDSREVRPISMPEEVDPEQGLLELKLELSSNNQGVENALRAYRDNPIFSLYPLAKKLHRNLLETLMTVIVLDELVVRCSSGLPGDLDRAHELITVESSIVLDPISLLTLFILESEHQVDARRWLELLERNILISEATISYLYGISTDLKDRGETIAIVSTTGGERLHLDEGGHSRLRGERLAAFTTRIKNRWKVEGGTLLDAIPLSHRRLQVKNFGVAAAQTLDLAIRKQAILWSDDLTFGLLARDDGVERVWTAAILDVLLRSDKITVRESASAVTTLMQMSYHFTGITAGEAIEAAEIASWQPERHPLSTVFAFLAGNNVNPRPTALILAQLIYALWHHPEHRLQAIELTTSFAARLRNRPDCADVLRLVEGLLPQMFRLEVVAAHHALNAVAQVRMSLPR